MCSDLSGPDRGLLEVISGQRQESAEASGRSPVEGRAREQDSDRGAAMAEARLHSGATFMASEFGRGRKPSRVVPIRPWLSSALVVIRDCPTECKVERLHFGGMAWGQEKDVMLTRC